MHHELWAHGGHPLVGSRYTYNDTPPYMVYEITENDVSNRYGLMGPSMGQCLMPNIVCVARPNEEGNSIYPG